MIVGMDWDFSWTDNAVKNFVLLWQSGLTEHDIAIKLNRRYEEIVILRMELAYKKVLPDKKDAEFQFSGLKLRKERSKSVRLLDINQVHHLYVKTSMTLDQIGESLGIHKRTLSKIINQERCNNPEMWPMRIKKRGTSHEEG